LRVQQAILSHLLAFAMRLLAVTLRIRIDDRAGLKQRDVDDPVIWCVWHNRMLLTPIIRARLTPRRRSVVLTSASRDGELLQLVMRRFRVESVRGSTSRRGAIGLIELARKVNGGYDAGITPDGPRGPRYRLSPGVITLAQKTGAPVMPVHVRYERRIQFRSWDRFMAPLPFSRVFVELAPLITIPPDADLEEARLSLEKTMLARVGDD
jgi:lysophospholipid acyltransferase (LPLAT)-like uncharacterized protein